jgi:hypothetical protein
MTKNDVLRFLIARLALQKDTVFEIDYGRIEELCFLINAAMNDFHWPPGEDKADAP